MKQLATVRDKSLDRTAQPIAGALWTGEAIQAAMGGRWITGAPAGYAVQGVSFSRRELKQGDLFLATDPRSWSSTKYPDDSDNLKTLFDAGAACVVVSRLPQWIPTRKPVLLVENTRKALDDLGKAARARLQETTIICITGSVGKSTTKEILGELLSHEAATMVSPGNHNHGPGVPLSLAKTPPGTRYGVYEFSVDLPRVTLHKAQIVRPHVAVITNIHPDHLMFYGSLEKLSDQKCLLFDAVEPGGAVVLNRDSPFFDKQNTYAIGRGINCIYSFGEHPESSVRLLSREAGSEGTVVHAIICSEEVSFFVPRPGIHVGYNCLAALAAIIAAGGNWRLAVQNLAKLPKQGLRKRNHERTVVLPDGEIALIDDTFSANPASVRAGLDVLSLKKPKAGGRRIAVLADIKELGETSPEVHASLAPSVAAAGIDLLFTLGPDSAHIWSGLKSNFPGLHSEDPAKIAAALKSTVKAGDVVYVKGSHRTEASLETLLESIIDLGKAEPKQKRTKLPIDAMPATNYSGPAEPLQIHPKRKDRVEILFLGDTAFGENYQAAVKRAGGRNILEDKGYDFPLAKMRDTLLGADLVVANLETPLTNLQVSPFAGQKTYIHWGHTEATSEHLLRHNISAVALANNHCFDYGSEGFDQTLNVLSKSRITAFGAGRDLRSAVRPLLVTAAGNRGQFSLAVISAFEFDQKTQSKYRPYATPSCGGLCPLDAEAIAASINDTKKAYPEAFVVVFPHWGSNYKWRTRRQAELATKLQSAGADLVLGHGAHMVQELEHNDAGWIVYSIGNFMFNSPGRYSQNQALPYSFIAKLVIEWTSDKPNKSLRLFPIVTDNKRTGYQTSYADQAQFDELVEALAERYPGSLQAAVRLAEEEGRLYLDLPL